MVGRSPSFLEAPVGMKPLTPMMSTTTLPTPAELPAPPLPPAAALEALPVAIETTQARLIVTLLGGEELELGMFDDRDAAVEAAQELVGRFNAAEVSGEWPEVDGRFLRLASIASIDVLVAE